MAKTKSITIKIVKEWRNDQKVVKILALDGLSIQPPIPVLGWIQYLGSNDHFVYCEGKGAIPSTFQTNNKVILAVGTSYTELEFNFKIEFLKRCGNELTRLHREVKRLQQEKAKRIGWSGEETITI